MQSVIRYFSNLRRLLKLNDNNRLKYIRRPFQDFTRKSPLTFARTACLILDLPRQSLAVELGRFFHWRPEQIVTKSAFCQRRQAINPSFFRDLFCSTSELFYRCYPDHKRWKGKRLLATDGSGQSLPRESWIGQAFGFHLNQHTGRPSTRLLFTYDLLNRIINRVDLHTQNTAEIILAYQNIDQLPTDAIYIYDQHYASFGLAYLHHRAGSDYLIRMPPGGAKMVRNFVKSGKKEAFETINLKSGRARRTLTQLGLNPDPEAEFKVRLVRVDLDDGTVEVLMTSLLDRRLYPQRDFKGLYGKRWGIETSILTLKSFLQLALISAYTQPGVEQDLWASFAFYNQQSVLIAAGEQAAYEKTKHRIYEYRINRNVTAGLIQVFLYHIYLGGPSSWRARTLVLLKLIPNYTEPYRPDRNNPRERKIMRANDRHIHEKNYRKAM